MRKIGPSVCLIVKNPNDLVERRKVLSRACDVKWIDVRIVMWTDMRIARWSDMRIVTWSDMRIVTWSDMRIVM